MVAAPTKEPAGEVTGLLTWAQGLRSRGDEREEAIRCGSGFRIEPVARMCSFAAIAAKKGGGCAGESPITDCCSSLRPGPVRGHRLDLGGRRLCRDLEEVGPNVEAVGGGSLNLAALTLFDMTSDVNAARLCGSRISGPSGLAKGRRYRSLALQPVCEPKALRAPPHRSRIVHIGNLGCQEAHQPPAQHDEIGRAPLRVGRIGHQDTVANQ